MKVDIGGNLTTDIEVMLIFDVDLRKSPLQVSDASQAQLQGVGCCSIVAAAMLQWQVISR
jgi:myo-inositol-1-phosphate synthase